MHLGLKLALTQSSTPPSEGGGGEPEATFDSATITFDDTEYTLDEETV